MKTSYKIYCRVSTNTSLGWDEETQTVTCPDELTKDFVKGNMQVEKIFRQGLPNADLYKAVFLKCTATGFMATAPGGHRLQNSHLLINESDEDWDGGPDLSELLGPHSRDKRPYFSK